MEMESHPRFRFRDHSQPESQNSSEPTSHVVSAASPSATDPDPDLEIESMTGRGIKHLCDELLELKEAANEDLQRNMFAKYSTFLRILKEAREVENELVQLENHFVSHQIQVKDLIDRIYPKILSIDITFEDHINIVPSSPRELEAHINECLENLDILMSENKIDEALHFLESAYQHYQSLLLQDCSHSEIMLYESAISEKKSMLIQQLAQIAEKKRTAGPELQRALTTLCRLGDSQLAVDLLLKHYHMRIVTGTDNLQWAKLSSSEIYIRELARFVFSIISQAARSFVMLCGETSPYTSELMLWAYEETKSFIICFDKYIKGTSAISGGLSTAIKAVKFAVMFCSLLENQKLMLRPYLMKHLCPCMEEILNTQINHFKKVIGIFSASDPWILEKYLVSGVFIGAGSSTLAAGEHDYCLLTTSGRKVLTLLQAIVEDVSPLVSLQMGCLVISGITNLFTEYITILERALTYETCSTEQASPRMQLAESLPQQVSILANLSTLVQFLPIMVKNILSCTDHAELQVLENHSIVHQQKGFDDFLLFIEERSNKLRNVFCQQLILRVLSTYHRHEIFSDSHCNGQFEASNIHNPMPSGIFQVLFLELRKIEQLEEDGVFEVNWLMGLLRELMGFMFIWVSKNKEILATTEENASSQTDEAKQFLLDVQFLVEIGMYGGYFSNNPLLLLTLMKSTFNSAGLDPFKDVDDDDWAIDAATKTIQKLLEIENASFHPEEPVVAITEESHEHEDQIIQSAHGTDFSLEDDRNSSQNNVDALDAERDEVAKHEPEVYVDAEAASPDIVFSPEEGSLLKDVCADSTETSNSPSISTLQFENTEETTDTKNELALTSSLREKLLNSKETKSKSDE